MATKAENLEAARVGKGCLGKAADGEPLFILRAQDKLAPMLVRFWAALAEMHGARDAKVVGAIEVAVSMEDWQASHPSKFPD